MKHKGIHRSFSLCMKMLAGALLACAWALVASAQADLRKIEAYVEQERRAWQVPGVAVAIVKDDKVIFTRGFGVREVGKDEPVDADTLFAIASNTKAFTAAAVALLVEEKKIAWDDRVVQHLPYFQLYDPYVTHDIRVRDLLCHRSGLGVFSGDLLWYGTGYSREEVLRRARFLKPAHPFRANYAYNNIAFLAAGEVVAAASGKTWDAFVKERIFEPLGMRRTVTTVRALAGMINVATPHAMRDGELRAYPWYNWDAAAALGGIISSANDMARWIRLQLGRGSFEGKRIFSEESSRTMWTPHITRPISRSSEQRFPSTHFRAYGLGWSLSDYRGRLIVGHGGAYDGMFSSVTLVPEERLGIVILTNSNTSLQDALSYRILDAFLGGEERDWSRLFLDDARRAEQSRQQQLARERESRVPDTRPSVKLEQYAGTYRSSLYGDATVSVEDGRLVLRLLPNPDFVADLSHWHFDTFVLRWRKYFPWFGEGKAQFVLDLNARITELKLDVPNEDFWFHEPEFLRVADVTLRK